MDKWILNILINYLHYSTFEFMLVCLSGREKTAVIGEILKYITNAIVWVFWNFEIEIMHLSCN